MLKRTPIRLSAPRVAPSQGCYWVVAGSPRYHYEHRHQRDDAATLRFDPIVVMNLATRGTGGCGNQRPASRVNPGAQGCFGSNLCKYLANFHATTKQWISVCSFQRLSTSHAHNIPATSSPIRPTIRNTWHVHSSAPTAYLSIQIKMFQLRCSRRRRPVHHETKENAGSTCNTTSLDLLFSTSTFAILQSVCSSGSHCVVFLKHQKSKGSSTCKKICAEKGKHNCHVVMSGPCCTPAVPMLCISVRAVDFCSHFSSKFLHVLTHCFNGK